MVLNSMKVRNSTCRFFDILKHSSVMHLLNANYMFEILNCMLKRVILDLLLYLVCFFKLKIRKAVVKKIVPFYQKKKVSYKTV